MHGMAKRFLNGRGIKSIEMHGQGWFHFKRAFPRLAEGSRILLAESEEKPRKTRRTISLLPLSWLFFLCCCLVVTGSSFWFRFPFLAAFEFFNKPAICSFWSARAGGPSSSSFGSPKTQVGRYRWFSNPPSLRLL